MSRKQPNVIKNKSLNKKPLDKKQRGSALVIAVFVMVVMLALTIGIARLLVSGSETVVYEVQGSRSLFAAQSGLEIGLSQLFALDGSHPSCSNTSSAIGFNPPAMVGCEVTLSCKTFTGPPVIFQLTSVAHCQRGDFITRRQVQIGVGQ